MQIVPRHPAWPSAGYPGGCQRRCRSRRDRASGGCDLHTAAIGAPESRRTRAGMSMMLMIGWPSTPVYSTTARTGRAFRRSIRLSIRAPHLSGCRGNRCRPANARANRSTDSPGIKPGCQIRQPETVPAKDSAQSAVNEFDPIIMFLYHQVGLACRGWIALTAEINKKQAMLMRQEIGAKTTSTRLVFWLDWRN